MRVKNIVYLDVETQLSADEVGGWDKIEDMKMSVAVTYQSAAGEYKVYRESDVDTLITDLILADLVVGFNLHSFDYIVLSGYSGFDFQTLPTWDILEKIHATLGFRVSLDNLVIATLDKRKIAEGLKAIEWFKEGDFESLEKYCKKDVELTRELFMVGCKRGQLWFRPKDSFTSKTLPTGGWEASVKQILYERKK